MSDELQVRLRVTAEEYEPDRDRIWSRVSEGMREARARSEPARTGWRIPQLALATASAAVLVGAVVLFGQTMGPGLVGGLTPEPPAAGPGTRTAEVSEPTEDTPSEDAEETTGETEPTDEADVVEDPDWMWTDGSIDQGSNDFWTQSNLTMKNWEPLVGLAVELRVAEGEGLEPTGAWVTDDRLFGDAEVTREDGFVVYRWTLEDGVVLPAGEYMLAGQFSHESAHSAYDDFYTFTAETESGERGEITGDFE
ncbi:hypothetical protein L0U85_07900 [Glycomyces sp. L485]|uniref:hypothetical protein n=1 Tax=Glycomyces sp. L485 TaxID=2909235 RepID=UPI001F4A50A1|nr:hypothetical protein [Glycomyces sp. L485]MCH7230773.1 hypothetical protein [Glycomyces sp. L485]